MRKLLIALCACAAMVPAVASATQAPTYQQMMREPEKLAGTKACWTGRVFDVRESSDGFTVFYVNPDYPRAFNVIVAGLQGKMPEPRIMQDDPVELCGQFTRLYTYATAANAEKTVPAISLDTVRRISNGELIN
jgi:hypothetical protein